MRIGSWNFTPGFWPTLAALVLFPLFIKLGFWQLDRADQKEQRHQQVVFRHLEPAISLNSQDLLRSDKADLLWRKATARGRYVRENIVLDNQIYNGEPGYFVLTPFQLAATDKWLLVNRGWVPAGDDRNKLPEITSPLGETVITGEVNDVPPTGLFLEKAPVETMPGGVYRVQNVDTDKVAKLVRHDLLPFIIALAPAAKHGYVREWRLPGSGKERNLGYAFQWFAFAVTLVVIYLVVNLKKVH
jgi:surfeit locus 1 family protein